jgi:hypothetical protein
MNNVSEKLGSTMIECHKTKIRRSAPYTNLSARATA